MRTLWWSRESGSAAFVVGPMAADLRLVAVILCDPLARLRASLSQLGRCVA